MTQVLSPAAILYCRLYYLRTACSGALPASDKGVTVSHEHGVCIGQHTASGPGRHHPDT